jgi:hypothetical protein
MFIGYNKARRSGLAKKDFLSGAPLLNPLRILVLRLGQIEPRLLRIAMDRPNRQHQRPCGKI